MSLKFLKNDFGVFQKAAGGTSIKLNQRGETWKIALILLSYESCSLQVLNLINLVEVGSTERQWINTLLTMRFHQHLFQNGLLDRIQFIHCCVKAFPNML